MCPPNGFESKSAAVQNLRQGVQILGRAPAHPAVELEDSTQLAMTNELLLA